MQWLIVDCIGTFDIMEPSGTVWYGVTEMPTFQLIATKDFRSAADCSAFTWALLEWKWLCQLPPDEHDRKHKQNTKTNQATNHLAWKWK